MLILGFLRFLCKLSIIYHCKLYIFFLLKTLRTASTFPFFNAFVIKLELESLADVDVNDKVRSRNCNKNC
jgi:hypothetical protein